MKKESYENSEQLIFPFQKQFIDFLLYNGWVSSIQEGALVFSDFVKDCGPIDWTTCPLESARIYYTNDGGV